MAATNMVDATTRLLWKMVASTWVL